MPGISGRFNSSWNVDHFYPSPLTAAAFSGSDHLSDPPELSTCLNRHGSGRFFFKSSSSASPADTLRASSMAVLPVAEPGNPLKITDSPGALDEAAIALTNPVPGTTPNNNYQFTLESDSLTESPIVTLQTDIQVPVVSDAGNSLETALNLGTLSGTQTFNEEIGGTDSNDYYRFSLNSSSGFSLSLTNLTADADVQLLNSSGNLIVASAAGGTTSESINRVLAAGNYYIRVYPYSSSTDYTLTLSASTVSAQATYNSSYGYGLVDAAASVAQAVGQPTFPAVTNLGGTAWGLDLINAPEVWARGYTGQGVTVAVIDSGVDYNHPDLNDNMWVNSREIAGNGIDDDGNGYVDDVRGWDFVDGDATPTDPAGHGTHIAGTIAAENNGFGVTGVAYNARIMPVRILDATGFGTYANIAAGIRYAANNGANVINLSIGGGGSSDDVTAAIQYATQRGAVVVIAAGNDGNAQPSYPANLAHQWGIAVGAVNVNNQLASFSNDAGSTVLNYVVAPGVSVYSTTPNSSYQYYTGTSMAGPHVAGVAALILSANPTLNPTQVINLLVNNANPNGITG